MKRAITTLAVVLLTLGIAAGVHYATRPQTAPFESSEIDTDATAAFFENECITSHTLPHVAGVEAEAMVVSYPCDWVIQDVTADRFVIVSPDSQATFEWPAAEAAYDERTLYSERRVEIRGTAYRMAEYGSDTSNDLVSVVDIPVANSAGHSGVLLRYTSDEHVSVLQAIVSLLSF